MNQNSHCYAVIFSSIRSAESSGYDEMAQEMETLASRQPGFIRIQSVRDPSTRQGITVSYWKDLESIRKWKEDSKHLVAQRLGKDRWYSEFRVEVCKVEKAYEWKKEA